MSPRAVVIYCGMLMSLSAFSVDVTLPSFPAIVEELDAPYSQVQWTITFYLFMAGVAQLLWGPLSDRVGRRPVLAAGLSIYLAGCLVSAFAPTIHLLLAGRLLQGFGGAAATVMARAVTRDLFSGQELARNLALAMAIFAVGPILAPLAGAAIAVPFGWRAIFAVLAVFALGLILSLLRLPETIRVRLPDSIRPSVLGARSVRLLAHPQSRYFLILSAVIMSSMIFILSSAPRLFDRNFGIVGTFFALMFALHGTGIIVGQTLNRRMIPRLGIVRAMRVGNLVLILSATSILVLALTGLATPWSMTAMFVLYSTSYLIVYSNASAMVLDPHGDIAGFAAAAYGFVSQIGASVIASVLILFTGDSIAAFGTTLLLICVTCFAMLAGWRVR